MSDPPAPNPPADDAVTALPNTTTTVTQTRKPYEPPRLLRFGAVRDLVLGRSQGFPEGAGTFRRPVR